MDHWNIPNDQSMINQLKNTLFKQCEDHLSSRLSAIRETINGLQAALQSETKSTAGDKHETGCAMVQLEREKAGQQLRQIQDQYQILNKIKQHNNPTIIGLGSIVITNKLNYFIAVSVGELRVDTTSYFGISTQTPIAQLLLGKKEGDIVEFRSDSFEILQVL